MRRIAILGSTGSIGKNALSVIRDFPDKFQVIALSTNSNIEILSQQIKDFHPALVCVNDKNAANKLKSRLKNRKIKLYTGVDGLEELVTDNRIDKILLAISGSSALLPLLAVINNKRNVALANKEALVMAGNIIMDKARRNRVKIIPVDSEQSAIWQCLDGETTDKLKNVYLTASGGPFRQTPQKALQQVSIEKVLKHPRWKMGKKISVDSATLINKGLEVLETMFLFNIDVDKIKVIIHPEAIIHSMVEFIDGVIMAQLSTTDMRIPIQYALSYPERLPTNVSSVDFCKLGEFHFEEPDLRRFPCLGLAYQAARDRGTAPCVLNAANEASVTAFLEGRLRFLAIPKVIEAVLGRHHNKRTPSLKDILEADVWAREQAHSIIDSLN